MKKLAIVTAIFALTAGSASAATVLNGSFENPGFSNANGYLTIPGGGSGIDSWTVTGVGVDLNNTYWEAAQGDYSVDLNSTGTGGVLTQITDLIVSQAYRITFAMSASPIPNNWGRGGVRSLNASVANGGGTVFSQQFDFDMTGNSTTNMGWVTNFFEFTATDTAMELAFASLNGTAQGAAIDNVRISNAGFAPPAVPLPLSGLLLLSGLGGMALLRRKKAA